MRKLEDRANTLSSLQVAPPLGVAGEGEKEEEEIRQKWWRQKLRTKLSTKQKVKGRSRKENDVSRGGAGQEDDVTREGETSSIGCPGHTSEANVSAANVRWSLLCRKSVYR